MIWSAAEAWSTADFDAAATFRDFVAAISALTREGYQQNPAVMICLLALVVLPMLAPLGLLLRQDSRIVAVASEDPRDSDPSELPSRVSWIERDGDPESRQRLGSGMLRIGRQDDNELCLDDTTVHRYHAVIYVSPDDEVIVANVSGTNGNGIRLNGTAVEQASLRPGDCIEVGKVRLRVGAGE